MKKAIIIIFIFFIVNVVPDSLLGQSYSIFPADTISTTGSMEDLETLIIQQINTTSGTLQLKWQKVSENVPVSWDASVCDNFNCYTSLEDSGTMNPVASGDYGFLLMHITAHGNYGTATIQYAVWDTTYPGLKDTLTFIHTVSAPTGINTSGNIGVNIYPTFVSDFINVNNNQNQLLYYFLISANGLIVKNGSIENKIIDCSKLENGVYLLTISDCRNTKRKEKIIIQH